MPPTGQSAGGGPRMFLMLSLLLGLTAGLVGTARASPVETEEAEVLTSDQVLRRVAAWLDAEAAEQRRQRALDGIHEQMDRTALELERLETKMDLKMDRLQEVLIGRDIKEDESSRRQEARLERVALLLIEVNDQLRRMEANFQRLADVVERVQRPGREGGDHAGPDTPEDSGHTEPDTPEDGGHTSSDTPEDGGHIGPDMPEDGGHIGPDTPEDTGHTGPDTPEDGGHTTPDTPQGTSDHTERPGHGPDESRGSGDAAEEQEPHGHDQELHTHDGHGPEVVHPAPARQTTPEEVVHPALKLLEAMAVLEEQILYVSDQLSEGLDWLDARLGKKFGNLKEILATMTASLRNRFFERRDHLEEVAGKILRLQTAAVDGGSRPGGDGVAAPENVITALEAAIYDVMDTDLWYMLSAKLEEAVGGQGNLTRRIDQIEHDMDQGFSKLYAQLTRLSMQLASSAPDPDPDPAAEAEQLTAQLADISQQLHQIRLQLAGHISG